MKNHVRSYVGRLVTAVSIALAIPNAGTAQIEIHDDGEAHSHGLHFSHPMVGESVSPDTKIRLDFGSARVESGDDKEWLEELAVEVEYAFHRAFSLEIRVPYGVDASDIGETHVGLKFANYAFEEQGVLLGYGLDFGLPTGSYEEPGHGHEEEEHHEGEEHGAEEAEEASIYEFEPFLNIGWMTGRWELVGFAVLTIPTNQGHDDDVSTEMSFNVSALYHVSNRLEALVEYDARSGLSGPGSGAGFSNVSPGVKIRPVLDGALQIGLSASVPVVDRGQFDTRLKLSAFYHF